MSANRKIFNAMPCFDETDVEELLVEFRRVLSSKLALGPVVREFEAAFAGAIGVRHAVAVHSGTDALVAACSAQHLDGGEVIVPADTFVATANAVILANGHPVIADIDARTLSLSVDSILAAATARTRGVLLVHLMGMITPEFEACAALCRERGWFLIEDAAHAHGASVASRKAGSLADAGCFSFYSTKIMATGEGGMVTTDNDETARFVRSFRHHGLDESYVNCAMPGRNCRMEEMRGLLGLQQLKRLNSFVATRRAIAARYDAAFSQEPSLSVLEEGPGICCSYWKYPLFFDSARVKEHMAHSLAEAGIEVGTPYDPLCHQHTFYRDTYGYKDGDMPVAEDVVKRYLCLPIHCGLSLADQNYVIETVLKLLKGQ